MKQSLSIEEACSITGLGRTKLYQLINAGELKARKIGKRTVILQEDIEGFLSNLQSYTPSKQGSKT